MHTQLQQKLDLPINCKFQHTLVLQTLHPQFTIMSRNLWYGVGFTGIAGVGYYLYNAGGDKDVAQKMAERKPTIVELSNSLS